jgi:hypothetical protein
VIRPAFALGLAALLVGASGAGGAPGGTRVLPLAGPVQELAADGGRVAILLRTTAPNCARDRVAVWVPASRTLVPIGAAPCSQSVSTGAGVFGVALAGTRVAYLQYAGGNTRELRLRLATLAQPRPFTAASAAYGLDQETGTSIGRLAGDGSLLAFDWWRLCAPCARANPAAPRGVVWRILPAGTACPQAGGLGALRRCRMVTSAPGSLRLLAVGGGLVVVRVEDEITVVRSADGAAVYSGSFPGLRAARIDDGVLLVLVRSGAKNALWTVGVADRRTSGPWALPSSPALRLEDFQSGIAVYVAGRDVHLLRLFDRRDLKIRAPGLGPVRAQLEAQGIFYSYRPSPSPGRGRVAFTSFPHFG